MFPIQLCSLRRFAVPLSLWVISVFAISTASIIYSEGDTATEFIHIQQVVKSGWDIRAWGNNNVSVVTSVVAPWLVETFHTTPPVIYSTVFVGIFALTPVLLYSLYRKLLNPLQSYFAALFFALLPPTYQEVPTRGKSMIAEPLVVVLFLVLLSNMRARYKVPIVSLLTVAVLVSHYTVGILLLCWLLMSLLVSVHRIRLAVPLVIGVSLFFVYFHYVGDGTILYSLSHWGDLPAHTVDVVAGTVMGSPPLAITILLPGATAGAATVVRSWVIPSWVHPAVIYLTIAWMLYGLFVLLRKSVISSPYFEIIVCAGISGLWCLMALAYPFMTKGLYISVWMQIGAIFLSLLFGVGITSKRIAWIPAVILALGFVVLR